MLLIQDLLLIEKMSSKTSERRSSIGANSTIVCGVTIGSFSLIGAGAVITKDVKTLL